MQLTLFVVPTEPKKKYGMVGFFGNNMMYRLRYVDKQLGQKVHKSLIAQGYNSFLTENQWAVELEITAPKENKIILSATINRIKRNIERDTKILKNLQAIK